jgi:hypothetical protein
MSRTRFGWLLAVYLVLAAAAPASAQLKFGDVAPDFPDGSFTDGRSYTLEEQRGKLVVLYFFESK